MMLRRVLSIVLAVSVISGCSMAGGYGGGGGGGGGGGSMTGPGFNGSNAAGIDISGFAFSPSSVTFSTSANSVTVTWTNYDGVTHSVTPDAGDTLITGADVASGTSYSFTVPKSTVASTYHYHCRFHTYMTGSITVQ